jgi:hypothetical protein
VWVELSLGLNVAGLNVKALFFSVYVTKFPSMLLAASIFLKTIEILESGLF